MSSAPELERAPALPRGRAIWLRGAAPGGAAAFVRAYVAAGFGWISTLAQWGGRGLRRDPELYAELRRAGVPFWLTWGLPTPSRWREELDPFLDYAQAEGAEGVIVDPELEWKGQDEAAREFAGALREGCTARGLLLAITSYSVPDGHPTFPWETFASVADLGIPQTYDRDLRFDPSYSAKAVRQWRARGFERVIVAGSSWSHRHRRDKTPDELRRHLAILADEGAVIFWSDGSIPGASLEVLASAPIGRPRNRGGGLGGLVVGGLFLAVAIASSWR